MFKVIYINYFLKYMNVIIEKDNVKINFMYSRRGLSLSTNDIKTLHIKLVKYLWLSYDVTENQIVT